jgi:hypothetical protein
MTISKLIQYLETFKNQYGDIEAVISYTSVSAFGFEPIMDLHTIYVEDTENHNCGYNGKYQLDENTKDNMVLLID